MLPNSAPRVSSTPSRVASSLLGIPPTYNSPHLHTGTSGATRRHLLESDREPGWIGTGLGPEMSYYHEARDAKKALKTNTEENKRKSERRAEALTAQVTAEQQGSPQVAGS